MEILTFLCGKFCRKSAISYDGIFQDAKHSTLTERVWDGPLLLCLALEPMSDWLFLLWKLATLVTKVLPKQSVTNFKKNDRELRINVCWFAKERGYLSNTLTILLMRNVCGCKCSISYLRAIRCISTTRQARAQRSQRTETFYRKPDALRVSNVRVQNHMRTNISL